MPRILTLLFCILLIAGCNDKQSQPANIKEDTSIKTAMEQLSPEDRELAQQQRVCPVTDKELGSMGAPIKVIVKDKPIFICCKGCEAAVKEKPDLYIQKVDELKANVGRR